MTDDHMQDQIAAPDWFRRIEGQKSHTLLHETNVDRALSILRSRRIRGTGGHGRSLEHYPHFIMESFPRGLNHLDVAREVCLEFDCGLPARFQSDVNAMPSPGFLEVYAIELTPWQCCLHADSPPIAFRGVSGFEFRPTCNDHLFRRSDARYQLWREINKAKAELRCIKASID